MTAPSDHSLSDTLAALLPVLERLRVPYCLLGALAVGAWSLPRMTQDVDALLTFGDGEQHRLVQALDAAGFRYDQPWADANPLLREWHLRFQHGVIPVDLLLPRDAHDRAVLERRRRIPLGTLTVWVIAPDDLVLHKLKVGRAQDFVDVVAVLQRQRNHLDMAYLQDWAERLGIQEELRHCLHSSEAQ